MFSRVPLSSSFSVGVDSSGSNGGLGFGRVDRRVYWVQGSFVSTDSGHVSCVW